MSKWRSKRKTERENEEKIPLSFRKILDLELEDPDLIHCFAFLTVILVKVVGSSEFQITHDADMI